MDEKNDFEKFDDVVLPGFRFHPTDEELVGFYLKRKIQQKPLPIELIKQVDIYKYDPWDLPKLATMGEKEWYFYCPRDRKYRNSTRPNRVTGAGFWKATGTDRPIYSSDASKCIGLKKSLVFYRGRAAKGVKTDWMMHEFRLPSLTDSQQSLRKQLDKDLPSNDGWAICRIFKKTNSMAQRALSQSWVSPLPESNPLSGASPTSDIFSQTAHFTNLSRENSISCTTENGPASGLKLFCSNNSSQQLQHHQPFSSNPHTLLPSSFMSQMFGFSYPVKYTNNNSTTSINIAEASFMNGGMISNEHTFNSGLAGTLPQEIQSIRSNIGFPFSLPEAWKTNDLHWESSQCPSEMSATSYSPNN